MKKKALKILYFVSLSVFLFSLSAIIVIIVRHNLILKNPGKVTESEVVISSEDDELPDNPIDFEKLKKKNSDIYAWIKVPNTDVDYPILQSYDDDDNFYLTHDLNKKYSFGGSIYTQRANSTDFYDRNTVIYGHDLTTGKMFTTLHKFRNKDFFDKNKYFYIYMEHHILKYKIISAYKYDDRHILNSFDFSDDQVFLDYLEYIKDPKSVLKNERQGIELNLDSKIVTLSTCIGNESDKRYLVQGVLVKDVETK